MSAGQSAVLANSLSDEPGHWSMSIALRVNVTDGTTLLKPREILIILLGRIIVQYSSNADNSKDFQNAYNQHYHLTITKINSSVLFLLYGYPILHEAIHHQDVLQCQWEACH